MNRFLRWLLPDYGTVISKEEAVEIVYTRALLHQLGWCWS